MATYNLSFQPPVKVFRDNQLGLNYAELCFTVSNPGTDSTDPLFGFTTQVFFPYRLLTEDVAQGFIDSWKDKEKAKEVIAEVRRRQAVGTYTPSKLRRIVAGEVKEYIKTRPQIGAIEI